MHMNKPLAKIVASIMVIFSLLSSQAVLPLQVEAAPALNWTNPNQGGNNAYKLSVGNVINSGLLTSLVGCTGLVQKVAKLTVGLANTIAQGLGIIKKVIDKPVTTKDDQIHSDELKAQQKMKEDAFREECINGIAVRLARNQLTAMTRNTMSWVTSGFNGDPLYVRDINSYMDSLTTEILEKENEIFKDPAHTVDYPYGRDYARQQVEVYKSQKDTESALKQDLTNYLTPGATPESFATDFSQGGWNGWLAFTQHPQNNPLGWNVKATEDLANKQSNAVANAKAEVDRNGGYIDQRKCVEYEAEKGGLNGTGSTCVANYNAQKVTETAACNAKTDPILKSGCLQSVNSKYEVLLRSCGATSANPTAEPKCLQYETVTPGSLIRSKVEKAINSPETQLELVKTLNDALNALFASLIDKFQTQGLSSLRSQNWTSNISGGFGSNSVVDSSGNSIPTAGRDITTTGSGVDGAFDLTKDLGNTYVKAIDNGSWNAQANIPELTARVGEKNHYYTVGKAGSTDITPLVTYWPVGDKVFFDGTSWVKGIPKYIVDKKGTLQIQFDYMDTARAAQDILPSVLSGIGELDYCIPGPNPSWKTSLQDTLDAVIGEEVQIPVAHQTPDAVEKYWTDAAQNMSREYAANTDAMYGENSPMQTEFLDGGADNPSYLPVAQVGISITKNIGSYADAIDQSTQTYKDDLTQTQVNIYKLNKIKDKVNIIIAAAQKRRDTKRVQAGLQKVSALCLETEKVTYISNGVLK